LALAALDAREESPRNHENAAVTDAALVLLFGKEGTD
jgi:hypothetical protein